MNPVPPAVITALKVQGYRITKARMTLLDILSEHTRPLSVVELLVELARRAQAVNKTTVYRELDFLQEQGFIRGISLGENKKRYEMTSAGHHHHLVCTKCESVEDIPLENELYLTENKIQQSTGFHVESHALEFFGICRRCQ